MTTPRDTYFQAIVEGLERLSGDQGNLFESCVCELLRDVYPGIAPVHGGGDFGFDGSIPFPGEEPAALFATIRRDVIGNLRKNLESNLKSGSNSRRVVVATSQRLTGRRRNNLRKKARALGFVLEQVFDQFGVASLLYLNPLWTRELLGLSSDPPALSDIPDSGRLLVELDLVGRDADLLWARETSGDRLIVGQPGSGKTSLLRSLASDGFGLFVVSDDESRIGAEIREKRPLRLILDDAHVKLDLLKRLLYLRTAGLADYEIIATSWPHRESEVRQTLGLANSQVHNLELMTRSEISSVYESMGIRADDNVMAWLIDMAANKPGLAATLGSRFLKGDQASVLEGDAVLEEAVTASRILGYENPLLLLGCISLGGRGGIPLDQLAGILDLGLEDAAAKTAKISSIGILDQEDGSLSVHPRPLRIAAIGKVFFSADPCVLDARAIVDKLSDPKSAVEQLAEVAASGTGVDLDLLKSMLVKHSSLYGWQTAAAHRPISSWILENCPFPVSHIAHPLLMSQPSAALDRLLHEAAEADSTGASGNFGGRAIAAIKEWVEDPQGGGYLERREMLAATTAKFALDGGNPDVAQVAAAISMSPKLYGSSADPARPLVENLRFGLLATSQLGHLQRVWKTVCPLFRHLTPRGWQEIREVLWIWVHPTLGNLGRPVADEIKSQMHVQAREMLEDLWATVESGEAVRVLIKRLAWKLGLELADQGLKTFETLYPGEADSAAEEIERANKPPEEVLELAEDWAHRAPAEVSKTLQHLESQASAFGPGWRRETPRVMHHVAAKVGDPRAWLEQLREGEVHADVIEPFVRRIAEDQESGWLELTLDLLETDSLRTTAARYVVRHAVLKPEVLARLDQLGAELQAVVEVEAMRGALSPENLYSFLTHANWRIRLAAACGLWAADPRGSIPSEFGSLWEAAVLDAKVGESDSALSRDLTTWWRDILEKKVELAQEWLVQTLPCMDPRFLNERTKSLLLSAIEPLDTAQRDRLIDHLPANEVSQSIVRQLVERRESTYRRLLSRKDLDSSVYYEPLKGKPDEGWVEMTRVGLEEGLDPKQVIFAVIHGDGHRMLMGRRGEYWESWVSAFEGLLGAETDPKIRTLLALGIQESQKEAEQMRQRDRELAMGRRS